MRLNYVLVDFENIQPTDLALLKDGPFKVVMFLGNTQTKLPTEVVIALQPLGAAVTYLQIEGSGSNALDFHIAWFVGKLFATEPDVYVHIISKDKGFDPLIIHLRKQKLHVTRQTAIKDIPLLAAKAPPGMSFEDKISAVVANLRAKKAAKPAKEKTLASTIHSIFSKTLSDEEVTQLIQGMSTQGLIALKDQKVTYSLPA